LNKHRGPIRALIADDDPTSLLILESLANSFRVETVTATNVASAKRLLAKAAPHIAILDVLFPDGDGVDIMLEIRKAETPTAVALISASLEEFPFHKCGENRPDMIFNKPLDCRAVSGWLEKQIAILDGWAISEKRLQTQE
jgi:DNA-binding response OmpR family regulator